MSQPTPTPVEIPRHIQRLFARMLAIGEDRETGIVVSIRDLRRNAADIVELGPAEPSKTAAQSVIEWCDSCMASYVKLSEKMQPLFEPKPAAPAKNSAPETKTPEAS